MKTKGKIIAGTVIGIMLIALVSAAILIKTINVDVTVDEAFATAVTDITFTGVYPDGTPYCQPISIENKAAVPLNAKFTYTELTNEGNMTGPNTINYTTDSDVPGKNVIIMQGIANYDVCLTVATGEDSGAITGQVVIERVA